MDFPSSSPGDPLTPGIGATADAKRLAVKDAPSLTKIPVLPISYGDAQPLLAALTGPMAPKDWRGALAISYHVGPGAAKVHLKVSFNWDIKPVYDVIAKIPGAEQPDDWVIRGNHHDAWVNGAEDPISGQVTLLEEARAFGELIEARMEAQAHDHLLRVGRRGTDAARLDRMGRGARQRTAAACGRLTSTATETVADIWT